MKNFDEQRLLDSRFQRFETYQRKEHEAEVTTAVYYTRFIKKKSTTLEVIVYNDTVMLQNFQLNISNHGELDTFIKLIGE